MPAWLDRIAQLAGELGSGRTALPPREKPSDPQALMRLPGSFDLVEVITELSLLRDCIVRLLLRNPAAHEAAEVWTLNQVLDRTLLSAVERHEERNLRVPAQLALREREPAAAPPPDAFHATFEQAAVGIAHIAPDGAFMRVNRRCCEIFGYSAEELDRLRVQDLAHPDDAAEVLLLLRASAGATSVSRDARFVRNDGRITWAALAVSSVSDECGRVAYCIGVVHDISVRKSAEAALHAGGERMRLLDQASRLLTESLELEATLAHIAHLSVPQIADYCLVELVEGEHGLRLAALAHRDPDCQRMAREIHARYPPKTSTTAGLWSVIRGGEARLHAQLSDDALRAAAQDATHLDLLRGLGLHSVMLVPLAARGGVIGMIAFAAAESKRRYGEEDLAFARELASRAAFALENARLYTEAQRATRAREDLLATVSHDLKNPLSAIHLATTILRERATQQEDTRARKHLESISRAAARMERLIADLLDMASIQAGRLSIERKVHDAAHIVRDALEQHQALAEERSILLMRQGEPGSPRVLCDRDRILQVLSNLIGNAIKFCRPGESVTLLCETRGDEVHFAVVDTGPGIASDDLPRIFEPYWTARSQARRGTGLGLFISKGILEMHGGRIWVESRVGLGTSFMFALPRA